VRLLLDTHTLFWWVADDTKLSRAAFAAIRSRAGDVYVSTASVWEMAIKVGVGKWPDAITLLSDFEEQLNRNNFLLLPISVPHARHAGLLSSPHRDPFDRLLAAQATIEGLKLVTADPKMAGLGADVLW
jgi:PIN domain nuclease of toxin-antitoxin system